MDRSIRPIVDFTSALSQRAARDKGMEPSPCPFTEEEKGHKPMAVNLNTDLQALNLQRGVNRTEKSLAQSMRRLSSGTQIESASEDAAGMAVAQQLSEILRGLNTSMGNVQNGYALLSTADGGLSEAENGLQRMRTLAIQAANGTLTDEDRATIQAEMNANVDQLAGIASDTKFNGQALLDGTATNVEVQVGAGAGETVTLSFASVAPEDLGVANLDVSTQAGAADAVAQLDAAIENLSAQRSAIGAAQNRVESTVNSIGVTMENVLAARSRITDVDVAQEMMNLTKGKILEQVGISTLAQGNMTAQKVLSLLG